MLRVSKWVKIPLLVDPEEMENLFRSVGPFTLYDVQRVTQRGKGVLSQEDFLQLYTGYIEALKGGRTPPPLPSPVLSVTEEALYAMPLDGERQLFKPCLPVVQMQGHAVRYSVDDQTFRSQLFGADGISWGIQLGYPQIYEEPKTYEILPTRDLPNGPLFQAIRKWMRSHTLPTPFIVGEARQNVPIRLGKGCFSWINSHPQLQTQGISVEQREDSSPSH